MSSTRKVEINLGETVKKTKFTPPSPIKATPTNITSNPHDICPASFSNADDVMLSSPNQNKGIYVNYSTPPTKDPPEGKTTAVIAVMRGKPKDGYHRNHSNKNYNQKLVRVLLDSGSDGDLVFVNKDKPTLLPYSKRLIPQSWNTLNGIFQTKHKARMELNFFKCSDSKRFFAEPDVVKYSKNNRAQYDLILGTNAMKELGIVLVFQSQDNNSCHFANEKPQ